MIRAVDRFLNNITMYRLVLLGLFALSGIAIVLSLLGIISLNPLSLLVSLVVLGLTSFLMEALLSRFLERPANRESALITSLILFFILVPALNLTSILLLAATAASAIFSKYLLAFRGRHIFNPAACGAFAMGLLGGGISGWWIGTPALLLPVAVLALLVVRKIRRFTLLLSFVGMALVTLLLMGISPVSALLSWPLVFFGSVMLTEPQTTPPGRYRRIVYGVFTGFLFASPFQIGTLYLSHELALLIGNVFSFFLSPKFALRMRLVGSRALTENVQEFSFKPDRSFSFTPGEYMEWTLPHRDSDSRGTRRYFTIASAPEEEHVQVAVRVSEKGSSFKRALRTLKAGAVVKGGSLSGDFTLPKDTKRKLVFIAGGIGMTPFRSMMLHLAKKGEQRDIVFLYTASQESDFVYREDLGGAAKKIGAKVHYIPTNTEGFLTSEKIRELVPDYSERTFYLSGPDVMVENYKKVVKELGIPTLRIQTDYFPGY